MSNNTTSRRQAGLWGNTMNLVNTTLTGTTRTVASGINTVANTTETAEVISESLKDIVSQYSKAVTAQASHHTELWDLENQIERAEANAELAAKRAQLAKLQSTTEV